MPTYAYQCSQCKHSLEVFQKITETPLQLCTECGHETLKRGPGGGIGVAFKGASCSVSTQRIESEPCSDNKAPKCCPCHKSGS